MTPCKQVLQQQRLHASSGRHFQNAEPGSMAIASSRAKRKAHSPHGMTAAASSAQPLPAKARASQQVTYGLLPGSSNALYVRKAPTASASVSRSPSLKAGVTGLCCLL